MLDTETFGGEIDSALDSIEADDKDVIEAGGIEVVGGESDDKKEQDSSGVVEKAGEEEDAATPSDDAKDGDRLAEVEGDKEGDSVAGEKSGDASAASVISDYAIEQAVRSGISITDAKAFASEESLLRVASTMQKVADASGDQDGEEQQEEDLLSKIPDLDPESFQPEVVEMFGALKEIIGKQQEQLEAIHEEQGTAEQVRSEQNSREMEVWFDREIADLGKDFAEALGEGDFRSLSKGSPQFQKRDAIATQCAVLQTGYMASGIEPPSRSDIFKAAARSVLHGEMKEASNKNVAEKLASRSKQHTQRVSGEKASNHISPEQEAAAELDRLYPQSK